MPYSDALPRSRRRGLPTASASPLRPSLRPRHSRSRPAAPGRPRFSARPSIVVSLDGSHRAATRNRRCRPELVARRQDDRLRVELRRIRLVTPGGVDVTPGGSPACPHIGVARAPDLVARRHADRDRHRERRRMSFVPMGRGGLRRATSAAGRGCSAAGRPAWAPGGGTCRGSSLTSRRRPSEGRSRARARCFRRSPPPASLCAAMPRPTPRRRRGTARSPGRRSPALETKAGLRSMPRTRTARSSRRLTHPRAFWLDDLPDWSPDGSHILFYRIFQSNKNPPTVPDQVMRVDADGSGLRQIGTCTGACLGNDDPQYSPDGREIVYTRAMRVSPGGAIALGVWLMSASGGQPRQITQRIEAGHVRGSRAGLVARRQAHRLHPAQRLGGAGERAGVVRHPVEGREAASRHAVEPRRGWCELVARRISDPLPVVPGLLVQRDLAGLHGGVGRLAPDAAHERREEHRAELVARRREDRLRARAADGLGRTCPISG